MDEQKFKLKKTCSACPEQYDVFLDGEYVGFMHLRHGRFTVEYLDRQIYSAAPLGDGSFDSEGERRMYLNEGCKAIRQAMSQEPLYEIED